MRRNNLEAFTQVSLSHWQPFLAKTEEQYSSPLLRFTSYNAFLHSLFIPSQQSHEARGIRSQGSWAYRSCRSRSQTHK